MAGVVYVSPPLVVEGVNCKELPTNALDVIIQFVPVLLAANFNNPKLLPDLFPIVNIPDVLEALTVVSPLNVALVPLNAPVSVPPVNGR
jgi:hypothetical protein